MGSERSGMKRHDHEPAYMANVKYINHELINAVPRQNEAKVQRTTVWHSGGQSTRRSAPAVSKSCSGNIHAVTGKVPCKLDACPC